MQSSSQARSDNNFCVYCHTLRVDGRKYIGLTGQKPEARWSNGKGYKKNPYFTHAINKYGWEAFDHEVLVSGLTLQEAQDKEIELIAEYNTHNQLYGFNLTDGGEGCVGRVMSEETKRKIAEGTKKWRETPEGQATLKRLGEEASIRNKGMTAPNKGKKHTEETRQKMRDAWARNKDKRIPHNKGRKPTPKEYEHILQMSRMPRRHGIAHYSEEARRKMAKAKMRPVICIDTNEVFESVKQAAEHFGVCTRSISDCCAGKTKSCKGNHLRYYNEYGGRHDDERKICRIPWHFS